jgi:hypothetical protein
MTSARFLTDLDIGHRLHDFLGLWLIFGRKEVQPASERAADDTYHDKETKKARHSNPSGYLLHLLGYGGVNMTKTRLSARRKKVPNALR